MTQGSGVLFVGSIMVDVISPVPRLPQSGQGVVAHGAVSRLGGCAFNSANIARQLAGTLAEAGGAACAHGESGESEMRGGGVAPRIHLFAPVGTGPFATFVRQELAARGMQAFDAPDAHTDTGAAICLIEPCGERTMLTLPGIECCFTDAWFAALEQRTDLRSIGHASLCGYEAASAGGDIMIAFFERHPHLQLWFAPGPMIATIPPEKIARVNALRPIWHLNDAELSAYTCDPNRETAGATLAAQCGNAVVVTAGADGCFVFRPDAPTLHVPTTPVRPTDTIGAGDSHLGTLMVAHAAGRNWEAACALANRVAGAVCGVEGAILSDEQFAAAGLAL